jgi:4-amino-4-deoxy-L-arabinose transferase-like glycosyltransferase
MAPPRTFILRLFITALVLRLAPVLLARGSGIGLDDMFQYDMLARSLASGNGFRWYAEQDLKQLAPYVDFDLSSVDYDPVRGVPTTFRAPLYPAFLALVYSISGTGFGRFLAARLAQAILLGAPLAPLTYFAARRILEGSEREARTAAWAVAVYPMLLLYPLGLGTENLFFLLVLASMLFLLRAVEESSDWNFLLSGFLLGLTALTRSVILPFAGLAVLWAWWRLKQRRGAVLIAAALILTIAPWIVRNSLLYGKLTGIETSLGYNLYVGYHPKSTGTFTFGPSLDLVPILDDSMRDKIGTTQALEFIREDPGRFAPLALSRLGHFFRLELRILTYFYSNNFFGHIPASLLVILGLVFGLPFAILSSSACFGATRLPPSPGRMLLFLLIAGYLLPHMLILSEERFHLALIPFLAILAAIPWTEGLHVGRGERWKTLIVPAALALLLLFNWSFQFSSEAGKYAAILGPEGNLSAFPY